MEMPCQNRFCRCTTIHLAPGCYYPGVWDLLQTKGDTTGDWENFITNYRTGSREVKWKDIER